MKNNVLFLLTLVFMLSFYSHAQRGVRIAYIDTEYILENVPEYQEATTQLEDKAQKWKNEIQSKLTAIEQKRQDLNNEKPLLTKELIDEREEDITFEENEETGETQAVQTTLFRLIPAITYNFNLK